MNAWELAKIRCFRRHWSSSKRKYLVEFAENNESGILNRTNRRRMHNPVLPELETEIPAVETEDAIRDCNVKQDTIRQSKNRVSSS